MSHTPPANDRPPVSTPAGPRPDALDARQQFARRLGAILALVAAAAVLVRDGIMLAVFSYGATADSLSWMAGYEIRSRPYALMAALTNATATSDPTGLIWLQIGVAAAAVGALVYVVARLNLVLGCALGALLLLNGNWAVMNRWLMTEAPFVSFHVLSLACLVGQFERRRRLLPWELVGAGLLYGWTVMVRPSGLVLLVPIMLTYLWFTRSWRRTSWLGLGIGLMLLGLTFATWVQTGKFRLTGEAGVYTSMPLFSYHLFDPGNGPVSARLHEAIQGCHPGLDYAPITIMNSNEYVWGRFLSCFSQIGWKNDDISDAIATAYLEAIRARPRAYLDEIVDQNGVMFTYAVGGPAVHSDLWMTADSCSPSYAWCGDLLAQAERHPAAKAALEGARQVVGGVTLQTTQPHLTLAGLLTGRPTIHYTYYDILPSVWQSTRLLTLPLWLLLVAVLLVGAPPAARVLGLGALVFIHVTMLSVVVGHVFIPRYGWVLEPFYTIVMALAGYSAVRLVARAARRRPRWAALQSTGRV